MKQHKEKGSRLRFAPLPLGSLPYGKNARAVLSTSAKNNQRAAGGRGPGEGGKNFSSQAARAERLQLIMRNAFLPSPVPLLQPPRHRKGVRGQLQKTPECEAYSRAPLLPWETESLRAKRCLCSNPVPALRWPPAPPRHSLGRVENTKLCQTDRGTSGYTKGLGTRPLPTPEQRPWLLSYCRSQPNYCSPGSQNHSMGFSVH